MVSETRILVRQAEEPDFPIWARMLAQLHPPQPESEFLRELGDLVQLPEPYVAFLAFDETGTPVGLLDARVRNYAEGCDDFRAAYIEDLWVEPAARRSGVARELLEAVEDWARTQELRWLGSDTSPANRESRLWHAANGFEEIEKLVILGKRLAP